MHSCRSWKRAVSKPDTGPLPDWNVLYDQAACGLLLTDPDGTIRLANRTFCRERVAGQIGVFAATPESLPRRFRSVASEAMNLTWARPTIISLVEGSPAAQAGIHDHDEIVAFNGELIPVTGTAKWMDKWLKRNGEKP